MKATAEFDLRIRTRCHSLIRICRTAQKASAREMSGKEPHQLRQRRIFRGSQMFLRSKSKSLLLLGASILVLSAAPSLAQDAETVISTGTRVTGLSAADSSAPITVIGSDA